jgi:EmrB/QacA subfamily drug resistance transporter
MVDMSALFVDESMIEAAETETQDGRLSPELLRVVLIASFGSLLLNLNSTSINVAISKLMVSFDAPLSRAQWIITGYLLALAFVLPTFRWAVERLGSRRLYVGSLIAFTATSGLCACAWSVESLIFFRALQGVVGGLLTPLTQTLAAQLAGPKRMGTAMGLISIPILVAPLLGPTLGGLVIQRLSWRWLFLFNAPLGLVGAWLALRRLPAGTTSKRTRLDFLGVSLLSPGIALFTYALSLVGRGPLLSSSLLAAFGISLALITAFVLDASRRPTTALIDLRLFKRPTFDAALIAYLLTSFGEFGAQLILPLYYQQARGRSAIETGLLLLPQGIGMLLTLPRVGQLTDRFDNGRLVIAGVVTTLVGTWAFVSVGDHTSYVLLSASLVLRGAGLGATAAPAVAAAYKHLTRDDIPNGTATINIVQRLGAPLGTAVMAVTLQHFVARAGGSSVAPSALARAFGHTFAVSAALSALALFAGLVLARSVPAGSVTSTLSETAQARRA